MIIDDKKANRKLEKYIANCYSKKCPFCNDYVRAYDIELNNVGYVKSKLNEVFFHNSCYRKMIKGESKNEI